MIEDIRFKIDNNGNEETFIIIDKFTKNNKNFIIYQLEGKEDIYAALYKEENKNMKIIPIENENDYDLVDEYLESL